MAAEGTALLRGDDELPREAGAVSDVVVLVVLGQAQHVLGQQLGLGDGAAAVVREWGTREVSEADSEPTWTMPPHSAALLS